MIEIIPDGKINTTVTVPGSKYIANRLLIITSLADGFSSIGNIPFNQDIENAIKSLKVLGVKIEKKGNNLKVWGTGGIFKSNNTHINVGESGTLLRFIMSLSALSNGKCEITGSSRILERPVANLLQGLQDLGVDCISTNNGYPPVVIHGGQIQGGKVIISGKTSSQYISSLLLVSPYAQKSIEIKIFPELSSKSYVDLTLKLMEESGIYFSRNGYENFIVEAGQKYQPGEHFIPGDWSSANYFLAIAAITKSTVFINDLDMGSKHGEMDFYKVLEKMGCRIEKIGSGIKISGTDDLKGVMVDMSSMPDAVQTLAVVALFARGETRITNISHLKYKECDRIHDTARELRKIGARVITTDNEMTIIPGKLHGAEIETYKDHRMAMSMALAGLKISGIKINNPECSAKSFPGYWDKLREIGIGVHDG